MQPSKKHSEWDTEDQLIAQINITPMVDVMLVLLIIFMVAAPMLTQGVNVGLPDTDAPQIRQQVEPVVISIKKNGDLFIRNKQIEITQLAPRIQAMRKAKPKLPVFIRGDSQTAYGDVARVMSLLESAGIQQISLVTEPQH
ncbi:MAG: protein TolR [Ghiorsea sp.]|nr:protein TolR [Ghiorsea sp.]